MAQNASVESKIGIKLIAEELDLPTPYLGKILQKLTGNSILQGVKGPNGGFYLNEECKDTKLIRIIEVIDGLSFFSNCGLGMHECSDEFPCPLHNELKVYRDGLLRLYSTRSVRDLVESLDNGKAFIRNMNSSSTS